MYWGLAKCEKCQWHFARELFKFVAFLQVLKFCGQAELAKAHSSVCPTKRSDGGVHAFG